jgi:hypothetical protein
MPTWLWIIIVNGVILALIGYIWNNMEGRVKTMERDEKAYTDKLIDHPLLTADIHEKICDKRTEAIKMIVEDSEKRTGLLIENAILRAFKNGKNGKKSRKVKR